MKTSGYLAVVFDTAAYDPEILMAFLSEWPFEAFHEEADQVTGYIPKVSFTPALEEFLGTLPGHRVSSFRVDVIPEVNWNARWEASFTPVSVGSEFYIRAAFHDPPTAAQYRHEILIAPRMAFGTGHHATTYMMLEALAAIPVAHLDVGDIGCGTGILSVAAAKLGARSVFGNDIQPEAIENCDEHIRLNHVEDACSFALGGIGEISNKAFDIILANVNTWVITDSAQNLVASLKPKGWLLLSGILARDKDAVVNLFSDKGLLFVASQVREGWVQLTLRRPD